MNMPFLFIFIFMLVPGAALVIAIINLAKNRSREEQLFKQGILYLKNLRTLLMHIQQHRGLTNGYLSGNLQAEAEIERLEVLLKKEIADVEKVGDWITNNSKWESILDHWSRLNASYKKAEQESNLKQHNYLIANLLYLIDDLAYAHHLGKLGLVDATDTDWRNLLFIAEYIGQARALGVGAVSRGNCSSVLRIQLKHLRVKIAASVNNNWGERVLQDFHHLLQVIEEQVVVDSPSISPSEYFGLATTCIEHVLREFDRQVDTIQFRRV